MYAQVYYIRNGGRGYVGKQTGKAAGGGVLGPCEVKPHGGGSRKRTGEAGCIGGLRSATVKNKYKNGEINRTMCNKWPVRSVMSVLRHSYNGRIHAVLIQVGRSYVHGPSISGLDLPNFLHNFVETYPKFDVRSASMI